MQKRIMVLISFLLAMVCLCVPCMAKEGSQLSTQGILQQQFDLLNWEEIKELEDQLKQSVPYMSSVRVDERVKHPANRSVHVLPASPAVPVLERLETTALVERARGVG